MIKETWTNLMNDIDNIIKSPSYRSETAKKRRIVDAWKKYWNCHQFPGPDKCLAYSLDQMITYKTAEFLETADDLVNFIKFIENKFTP